MVKAVSLSPRRMLLPMTYNRNELSTANRQTVAAIKATSMTSLSVIILMAIWLATQAYLQRQKAAKLSTAVLAVVEALEQVGGEALITADHGNAEQMVNHELVKRIPPTP